MDCEGWVLRAVPYGERDCILTLFTPNALLKLFAKGRRAQDFHHQAITTPFTHGHYTYRETKSDLHRLQEGKIVDQHLKLRDRLTSLETAQKIAQALFETQWQAKEVSILYALSKRFIEEIPDQEEPRVLFPFFLVKLMKHEGILDSREFSNPRLIEAIGNARSFASIGPLFEEIEIQEEIETFYQKALIAL